MTNIKRARLNAGFGQKEVAIHLKVSQPAVSNWENGNTVPSGTNLIGLANLLSVSADYLLGLTNWPNVDSDNTFLINLSRPNILTGTKMTNTEKKRLANLMGNAAEKLFFDEEFDEYDKEAIIQTITETYWRARKKSRLENSDLPS